MFRLDDMTATGGRPLLDAMVMLLSAQRFFGVAEEHQLPRLLAASRKRQAHVTNEIAAQVFVAVETLLSGFAAAAERDGSLQIEEAVRADEDHVYGGLLTVLLRLVFVLYAEDKDLLPTGHKFYAENFSIFGLFEELQRDYGAFPDSMDRRFGAWARLVSLFRAVWLGVRHGDFELPPRRGQLFDPHAYPFLEGWSGGSAPITQAENRAAVRLPSVDDLTVYRMLEKLIVFEGQRLSYATLDVEQIGSVYEALMGYHVVQVFRTSVCLRPSRTWVAAEEALEVPKARRAKWLQETAALQKSHAGKVAGFGYHGGRCSGGAGVVSAQGVGAGEGGAVGDPAGHGAAAHEQPLHASESFGADCGAYFGAAFENHGGGAGFGTDSSFEGL